jgi:hypothetical protein
MSTKSNTIDGSAVMKESNDQLMVAETRRKALVDAYTKEERVPIYLAPMYAPYFGNVMTVAINGVHIRVAVNGQTQKVPKSFADEITSRRMKVDEMLRKMKRMSNITANKESSPGELKLF